MTKIKTIAVIAHDEKKADIVAFANDFKNVLKKFNLYATGTTGKLLSEKVGLNVKRLLSGPIGGDAQIASMVATKKIDAVIFIIDPLTAHPHDTDINTLMRVCNVHNVPIAINIATAIHLLSSKKI